LAGVKGRKPGRDKKTRYAEVSKTDGIVSGKKNKNPQGRCERGARSSENRNETLYSIRRSRSSKQEKKKLHEFVLNT